MVLLQSIANFILDMWLWNMTWGWYQVSLAFIFMWIFIVFMGRMKSGQALLLILSSYVVSFAVYSFFVIGVLIYWLQWEWAADSIAAYIPVNVLVASFYLGAIYTALQTLFFVMIKEKYCIVFPMIFFVTIASNSLGALLATYFIYALEVTP
ncbi:MAG: hypothetical protein WCD44_01150 [Candidatus Babeliales bacterium]